MSDTSQNPLAHYENAVLGLKAQSGPDLPPALGGALGCFLDSLTDLLHHLVDALEESDEAAEQSEPPGERGEPVVLVLVLATHLDSTRDVGWGPFNGPTEAERCVANLAANPRVAQARIVTAEEFLRQKRARRPSIEDFKQWVGGQPGKQGAEGGARSLGDISKGEMQEVLAAADTLEATSRLAAEQQIRMSQKAAIDRLRKENARLESENVRLRQLCKLAAIQKNMDHSAAQPEAMAERQGTGEGLLP